jgi:SAM-dependent methyltransferase
MILKNYRSNIFERLTSKIMKLRTSKASFLADHNTCTLTSEALSKGSDLVASDKFFTRLDGADHQMSISPILSFDQTLDLLSEKWKEVPGGEDQSSRIFSNSLLDLSDSEFIDYWDCEFEKAKEFRLWYFSLYRDFLQGKKVLEIGSGLGFDAVYYSQLGAKWVCSDIAPSNILSIQRIAKLKGAAIETVVIQSLSSLESLDDDFDVIWCNGSLHHAPFEIARQECCAVLSRMKSGGRWIEMAYPRQRWVREGALEFSKWGKSTDGERTPWVEWYDAEKIKRRLYPHKFETILEYPHYSNSFVWIDLLHIGKANPLFQTEMPICPIENVDTPPGLWDSSSSIPINTRIISKSVTVEIILFVTQGSVGLALSKNGNFISREAIVDSSDLGVQVYISTDNFELGVELSVRNTYGSGPSRFRIESINIRTKL